MRSYYSFTPEPPLISQSASHINDCYLAYADELSPLADFKVVPDSLHMTFLANGDIILCYPDGQEANFDVIGVIVGCCLDAPTRFSK